MLTMLCLTDEMKARLREYKWGQGLNKRVAGVATTATTTTTSGHGNNNSCCNSYNGGGRLCIQTRGLAQMNMTGPVWAGAHKQGASMSKHEWQDMCEQGASMSNKTDTIKNGCDANWEARERSNINAVFTIIVVPPPPPPFLFCFVLIGENE